jgi:hypothetical protein
MLAVDLFIQAREHIPETVNLTLRSSRCISNVARRAGEFAAFASLPSALVSCLSASYVSRFPGRLALSRGRTTRNQFNHAPQSLNLSQQPVQLVPTRENRAHYSTQNDLAERGSYLQPQDVD